MHKTNAPIIPSLVFLGEIPCAKGVWPKSFPNRSPPLSACHERQNKTEMYLGLIEMRLFVCLLKAIKDVAERGNEGDKYMAEDLKK